MPTTKDAKCWQYRTTPFVSGGLKIAQYSIYKLHDKNAIDYNDKLLLSLESSKAVIEY